MKKIRFTKMHGAGNDFVLIDDREETFPERGSLIAAMASDHTGIGCEGVILVRNSSKVDFRMTFYNPDGTEAELCGNGSRCVAAFAKRIGAVKSNCMTFETGAGLVDAEIVDEGLVRVWMPEPNGRRYDCSAVCGEDGSMSVTGDYLVVGVPHFIVPVSNVTKVDVEKSGRALRLSREFAPNGTNVDFVQYIPPSKAIIRTYERGVEAESGACGTGAVATAVAGVEAHGMSLPMHVRSSQGYDLVIDGDYRQSHGTGFTLTGPVRVVFEGEIDLDLLSVED
jgi:diaminopimelate epimerase